MTTRTQRNAICQACGATVEAASLAPLAGAQRCQQCGVPLSAGGFQIVRVLAQTPHSRVFLATKDGQQVALKELLFALVPQASDLDAFEREARLLRQLSHPRIPRFVASFREGEGTQLRLYLAQEFVPGGSLLEELEHRRFGEADARQIAREVLAILRFLHGLSPQVIHRDLKPANLMVAADGHLMLVDFGAARDLVRGSTHGSTLVGTFGYMPPEQLGGTVDATSDLYALGATLIHLLSRRSPDELLKGDLGLDFAGQINASPAMEAFLARLVARDRSRRFPSAQAALDALDAPSASKPSPAPSTARNVSWVVGVATAAATAFGLFALIAQRSSVKPATVQTSPGRPVGVTPAPEPIAPARPAVVHPPRHARASPDEPPAGVDVADVIEMPKKPRKGRALLANDLTIAVGSSVQAASAGCTTPLLVKIDRAKLQAEGPGSLADPRSLLEVELSVTNQGGPDPACERATLELRSGGALVSRKESVENERAKTMVHRRVSFDFPRTLKAVDLCVGETCAGTLDLQGGAWHGR